MHRPPPRPFPGKATGRGFLDGCVTSRGGVPGVRLCLLIGGRGAAAATLRAAAVGGAVLGVERQWSASMCPRSRPPGPAAAAPASARRGIPGHVHGAPSVWRGSLCSTGDGTEEGTRAVSRPLPAAGGAYKVWPSFGAPTGAQLFRASDLREESPRNRAPPSPSLSSTRPASYPHPHPHLKRRPEGAAGQGVCRLGFQHYLYMTRNKSRAICTSVGSSAE